jgi:hypothetical protein
MLSATTVWGQRLPEITLVQKRHDNPLIEPLPKIVIIETIYRSFKVTMYTPLCRIFGGKRALKMCDIMRCESSDMDVRLVEKELY